MSYLEQLRKKEDFCEFEKVTGLHTCILCCENKIIVLSMTWERGYNVDRFSQLFNGRFEKNTYAVSACSSGFVDDAMFRIFSSDETRSVEMRSDDVRRNVDCIRNNIWSMYCKKYPYIHIYFVASFPYSNGAGSVYIGIRKSTE